MRLFFVNIKNGKIGLFFVYGGLYVFPYKNSFSNEKL